MSETQERLIRKVIENKKNKQKLVTIPKNSQISAGDYVELLKVPDIKRK